MHTAVKTEDGEEADDVKSDVADDDVDMKSRLEVHNSSIDTKQEEPLVNDTKRADTEQVNCKGE